MDRLQLLSFQRIRTRKDLSSESTIIMVLVSLCRLSSAVLVWMFSFGALSIRMGYAEIVCLCISWNCGNELARVDLEQR